MRASLAENPKLVRLGWTLPGVVLAVLPHVTHLPVWIPLLLMICVSLRLLALLRGWRLPPPWVRMPLAFGAFIAVLLGYGTVNGLEPGSALLTVMVAMKTLETSRIRDHVVLLFVAYFLTLAAFLVSQSMLVVAYLLVVVISCGLLQATKQQPLPFSMGVRLTSRLLLQAAPIMLVLFVLFPRVPGPFWALPSRANQGTSGLSDQMSPGDITELSLSDAVAFRIRFDGDVPPPWELYWRGPVLSRFNGRTWSMPASGLAYDATVWRTLEHQGPEYGYRVTLEPHGQQWVFVLEMPTEIDLPGTYLTRFYQVIRPRPIARRISYTASSRPDYQAHPKMSRQAHQYYTNISASNPRATALARDLRRDAQSDWDYAQSVFALFGDQDFYYTLTPPALGAHPVDEFLFETREGFCEHFASAFTMMMRAAGVPARVVTGYQGGELNPMGQYYIVRQADAHAWSEIWLADRGWVRVDPTAAVAPERIRAGLSEAMGDSALVPGRALRNNPWLNQLVLTWDAVTAFWNQWVLGYGPELQRDFLSRLGLNNPNWKKMATALLITPVVLLIALSAWLAWQSRPRHSDEAARLYARFCRKLSRARLARPAYVAPEHWARTVAAERPDLSEPVNAITQCYLQARYEPAEDATALLELRERVANFSV